MPTYEYACSSCQHEWEAEQSIKDAALTECPACHQPTAKRQISRSGGFILKGGGWYSDLYSSPSNKSSGETKTSATMTAPTTTGTAPAATSGESTPAPKTDSSATAA